MDLPFELFVAVRYLLARRKQAFISLISLISVIGVSVGVMALLIALALMTGLQGELRDRLVGSAAHVYVFRAGGFENVEEELAKLRALPRVTGAAPVMLGQGLAQAGDKSVFITMKGIVPALEPTVTEIANRLQAGSLGALEPAPGQRPSILLGRNLAEGLGVYVGDTVDVLISEERLTPFGVAPQHRVFKVAGIFNLGLYEYDATYGFIHLSDAEKMFGRSTTTFIELRVDDMFKAAEVADGVPQRLGPEYQAQDWADMNKSLFGALWLEKMAISITIGLIVMVAALNIIASLILLVMEKSRDIAILKTMGSTSASIRRIFVLQGLIIGLVGTASGAIAGYLLITVLDRYKLIHIPIDVYQISYIPFRLQPFDFLVVILTAVLICFLATIYPSRQASKLDPAQALRYQ
jgi:lipoprotein-releasing system permease protein